MRYQPEEAWVVNLSLRETLKLNKTEIQFLPFYEFIGERKSVKDC